MITLKFYPYDLKFTEIFAVSSNARTSTDLIIVELSIEGKTGYGQASFPPYLSAKRDADLLFLSRLDLANFDSNFVLNDILLHMDTLSIENLPAKAAIDMALHDLSGQLKGLTVRKMLGLVTDHKIFSSFTIGIGKDDFVYRQLERAKDFKSIKIKLGSDITYNKHVVNIIRNHTDKPIGVDFNQALLDKETAISMIEWLSDKQVEYAEQPMPAALENAYRWLKANSPLDIFGDESIQNNADIIEKCELFHGVNIKLMKCGGISKALEMVSTARNKGLKLMIGCMAESACAITAAANLAGLFDKVDLDGHLLNANDPFVGLTLQDGELVVADLPGLGIEKVG